ncbi:MAG: hypothetical protein ABSH31_01025 [Bryobacteraceae bacterium]|jgi:hypothetical protein
MPGIIRRSPLLTLAILLAAAKAIQFAIDSTALFFFDSGTFILNAMRLAFLPERSYVYSYLLRIFALPFHSLRAIVAMQMVMGAITAWLLGFVLLRFLRVRVWIAILAALVFAFDPVQIVHEHLVMAETAALFVMAIFLLVASQYLRAPRLWQLPVLAFLGILLVSLRIVYLPLVLLSAALLPAAAYFRAPGSQLWRPRALAVALAVSCGSTFLFHLGYTHLTGWLVSREPAYSFVTGFFLAAAVAPIIKAQDSSDPRVVRAVVEQNKSFFPLASDRFRDQQLWQQEGLSARLRTVFGGDNRAANQAAQSLARAAIRRDPLGFLKLGVHNYLDYWRGLPNLRWILPWENGSPPEPEVVPFDAHAIRTAFGSDVSNQHHVRTRSRRFHIWGRDWYVFLLVSPLLGAIALWLSWKEQREAFPTLALFFLWSCILLVATCLGAVAASYRFLHPFSFTGLAAAAFMAEILFRHWWRGHVQCPSSYARLQ